MHHPSVMTDLPRGLKISLAAAAALLLLLLAINQPLQTSSAPQGIISFQLAGTSDQSLAILRSWRPEGIAWAQASLWVDFLFIPAYLMALVMLTTHLTRDRPGIRERNTARWVKALFTVAAASDLTENVLLLNNLSSPTDSVSLTATICALIKFTGLMLGMAGLVVIRAARRHPLAHH